MGHAYEIRYTKRAEKLRANKVHTTTWYTFKTQTVGIQHTMQTHIWVRIRSSGLPALCLKKVWELREVLDVASWVGALFPFLSGVTKNFFAKRVKSFRILGCLMVFFCDGKCKKRLVLSIYKKVVEKSVV